MESLCHCSGDSKYVLTGGEDDLVSLFSLEQQAVVAWGEGHTSYVSPLSRRFIAVVCASLYRLQFSAVSCTLVDRRNLTPIEGIVNEKTRRFAVLRVSHMGSG